jgi:hypothetical protein
MFLSTFPTQNFIIGVSGIENKNTIRLQLRGQPGHLPNSLLSIAGINRQRTVNTKYSS